MPNAVGEILEQIGHRDCAGNRCRSSIASVYLLHYLPTLASACLLNNEE